MRTSFISEINQTDFKEKLLRWSSQFKQVVFLDSNEHDLKYSDYDCILAVDAFTSLKTDVELAFGEFSNYLSVTKDWLFGYFSYDLKNSTEALSSENFDGPDFPELYFFQPKKLLLLKGTQLEMRYLYLCDDEIQSDLQEIMDFDCGRRHGLPSLEVRARIAKEKYIEKIQKMLGYIHRGDIYEANFCMEFYAENVGIDPLETFISLNAISGPPFAAFFKRDKNFLMCASPERYLKKTGSRIITQPIKGTARRGATADADETIISSLRSDPKERSENIMIVDLVRNDLSRTAQKGSVQVSELCEIYTFPQVHQMISTITSELDCQYTVSDLIKTTFPMGSMTGAPKISAMKIIEELEESKRGVYSGALGYFTPESDFDLNVVIRSIIYNADTRYASFSVGSAITSLSDPEREYEECLLKAKAMFEALGVKKIEF
ncbi:anthranilate synthase component I family protein [Flavobacterium sp.]|uniref:anthranilate synthase component I family protein n=1 Tax=Flavobacterium sp. TaxID=239 RepID=UPI0026280579|nr:anthranilate synthase component I family protein [Flavobacterium sp.]